MYTKTHVRVAMKETEVFEENYTTKTRQMVAGQREGGIQVENKLPVLTPYCTVWNLT